MEMSWRKYQDVCQIKLMKEGKHSEYREKTKQKQTKKHEKAKNNKKNHSDNL